MDISDNEALETLRLIQPKKYEYVDQITHTNNIVYGYIAQQIKDVLPYAVNILIDDIPNIYKIADISCETLYSDEIDSSNQYVSTLQYTLTIRDYDTSQLDPSSNTLKLYDYNNKETFVTIKSIIDGSNIIIEEDISDCIYEGTIFVYGQRVEDFHTLSKEHINVVTLSAVQELDRTVTQLKEEKEALQLKWNESNEKVNQLEQIKEENDLKYATLETQVQQQQGIIENLISRIEALETT